MNVAVPSAQHSLRFGQPASSHTVTNPSERTVCLSRNTSGPWWTWGRNHSGLRVAIDKPPVTPACSIRCTARDPGPRPWENGARSSGRCFQATSWRSSTPPPHVSAARRATMSATSDIGTSTPSSASDVTGRSAIPHGTM